MVSAEVILLDAAQIVQDGADAVMRQAVCAVLLFKLRYSPV